jgi:hypothetical protein
MNSRLAVAIPYERMDLPGQQIDSRQQAERAMTSVLMIAREGRCTLGTGGKSGAVVAMAWIPGFSS